MGQHLILNMEYAKMYGCQVKILQTKQQPVTPQKTKPKQSKPVFGQRTITKLAGISLLSSGMLLTASKRKACLTVLSMVALSIMATSSVVYAFTFN